MAKTEQSLNFLSTPLMLKHATYIGNVLYFPFIAVISSGVYLNPDLIRLNEHGGIPEY